MPTTLRDIAEHLSLSPGLVSRVLNNKPGIWASDQTCQRIKMTAQEMNYRPSASARALVTGRTMQIAISSADKSWHRGESGRLLEVSGVIDAAAANRYRVLVLPSPQSHADRNEFEALLHSKICDGLCLYAEQANMELYSWLQEHNIPFVIIGNPGAPALPFVDQDNYRYAYSSVQWLHAQGHKRVVWSSTANEVPDHPHVVELKRGYTDALRQFYGMEDSLKPDLHCRNAAKLAHEIGKPDAPTAVIVRGLASTMQWKLALQLHGVRLPEDFTLLAHLDPTELSFLKEGELTEGIACHLHDPKQIGQKAAEALIQGIEENFSSLNPILVAPPGPIWCSKFKKS